ncbi:hypothetical protein KUCAC02_004205, partial [Chaenocephalus aceratus]
MSYIFQNTKKPLWKQDIVNVAPGSEAVEFQYATRHIGWRAPSIKQVFEKGRQREKVSAKYLKECGEERGARPEGDKAVSRTLSRVLCLWI